MTIWRRWTEVRLAQARMTRARGRLAVPASALLQHARRHPLWCIGAAGGGGYVMGRLALRPWRIPGVLALLGGEVLDLSGKIVALAREFRPDAPSP